MVLRGQAGWPRRARWIVVSAALGMCALLGVLPAAASAARHFEQVSPERKGNGDIVGDGDTTLASRLGDAVVFSSRTPFGDTAGSGQAGQTQYIARRTDAGWRTHAITPLAQPEASQLLLGVTALQLYSEDLRTAIVRAYDLPAVSDDTPHRFNIYTEDTATRQLETVGKSQVDPLSFFDFSLYPSIGFFWGLSADARHLAFVSVPDPFLGTVTQFLPEAAPGVPNVYEWDNGVLKLVGILPDGTVPPSGSDMPASYRATVSADGRRQIFTASSQLGPSQLFMRIDGNRTAWISQPELTDDPQTSSDDQQNDSDPSQASLQAVTPDGRTVFFTTDAGLVDEDTNGATDLYRYTESSDPSTDRNLTLISHDGDLGGGEVVGMSDDGGRVYYQTAADHLVVWDHGTTRLISGAVTQRTEGADLGVKGFAPGAARVTPDGNYLAFVFQSGTSTDPLGYQANRHAEMYVYSLRDDRTTCASCPQQPATSDATVLPAATEGRITVSDIVRPRFLTPDGHVFFSTAEELVPQDRNNVLDTYEYDPISRTVTLVSTGKGSDPATFADASENGDDVFFVTRQRLVASDHDDLVDVYDARDGSTLNEPAGSATPPCEGDTCQPPPSASPPDDTLGSLSLDEGSAQRSSKLLVVRRRIVLHGAAGSLRVELLASGRLAWSGKGVRAGSIGHARRGAHTVRLRLRRAARVRLRTSGTYTTAVHLRFVSVGGDEVERTIRVTFRAARKGR